MRSKWEDPAGADLDAPASLTERDLRALRRRAGFGVMGVMLALVAVAGLGWVLYAGTEGLDDVQVLKDRVIPVDEAAADQAALPLPPARPLPVAPNDSLGPRSEIPDSLGPR